MVCITNLGLVLATRLDQIIGILGVLKRIVKFSKIKISDEPKHFSEWSLRQDESWNKIWDCGNLKFIKILGEKSYV